MEFVFLERDNRKACVRAEWADAIAGALLNGDNCSPFGEAGRGALQRFPYEAGHGILRVYRRGGFVRHFIADAYLLQNRALRELRLHAFLFENGLSVPAPLGAAWKRSGLVFRGAIATDEVNAVDLAEYLRGDPSNADETIRECGALIRRKCSA